MQRQTTIAKAQQIERKWYVVDASNLTLGRLASVIAKYLTGKNKAIYTPNVDCGDYIIVVNAEKVALSGDADHKKNYYNVSQYLGGLRTRSSGTMLKHYPEEMIERAVKGMLPKGRLGRQMNKKLFVYAGPEHLHEAQQPEVLEIKY
jgi:large subunit ribosomal protein L13